MDRVRNCCCDHSHASSTAITWSLGEQPLPHCLPWQTTQVFDCWEDGLSWETDVTGHVKVTGHDYFLLCPLYFFQIHSALVFVLSFFALFQSCCSHEQVSGRAAVQKKVVRLVDSSWLSQVLIINIHLCVTIKFTCNIVLLSIIPFLCMVYYVQSIFNN